MTKLTLELIQNAVDALNSQPPPLERPRLYGPQWMIDGWKEMFGDSVDYVLSKDITDPIFLCDDNEGGE